MSTSVVKPSSTLVHFGMSSVTYGSTGLAHQILTTSLYQARAKEFTELEKNHGNKDGGEDRTDPEAASYSSWTM